MAGVWGRGLAGTLPLLLAIAAPTPAVAVAASTTGVGRSPFDDPPATGGCELHVWPAAPMQMLSEGWIANHVVDRQLAEAQARFSSPARPLDTVRQVALLRSADLATLLHRPGTAVTVHDEPAPRRQPGGARTRRTASAAPCYAELVVAKLFYTRTPLSRGSLRAMFSVEDYGGQPVAGSTFSAFTETPLRLFPPTRQDDGDAAEAELGRALLSDLGHFAAQVAQTAQAAQAAQAAAGR